MLIVGLTGGIGAGKTIVARVFEALGIPIYNSDKRAKQLMNEDKALKESIQEKFGSRIYTNGELQRKELANIVFNDPKKLTVLNAMVHPCVAMDFKLWTNEQKGKYVIKEAAILYESGAYKGCDEVIGVFASKDVRVERIISRDGAIREDIVARMENQMNTDQMQNRVNYKIDNSGDVALIPQVMQIHNALTGKQ